MAAYLHPHLADPDGDFFFTRDAVNDSEFPSDQRDAKRRRIEDLSWRYLKGQALAIHSARLRGPFIPAHGKGQHETRKRRQRQKQKVEALLRQDHEFAHSSAPVSPKSLPEQTPVVIKEATREWLRRLEPPAGSPDADGDISRLEDRLDRLERRTPSKSSLPPSIEKNPSVNHVLGRNDLKLTWNLKEKKKGSNRALASDSLLDLCDLDFSGKSAVRSNSQPTLTGIPLLLQADVDEDSLRRKEVEEDKGKQILNKYQKPVLAPEVVQEPPPSTEILLSVQANVDKNSVRRSHEVENEEGGQVDHVQVKFPRPATLEIAQEAGPGRAPLTSRTTGFPPSPARKTVYIADGQENIPCDGKTSKEPSVRPQHARTLSEPARQNEKKKKSHTLHASPTVFHSPFVYRKASDEEKPKPGANKEKKRRAATARFVEFGSSPMREHPAQPEVVEAPKPESNAKQNIPVDAAIDEILREEGSLEGAHKEDVQDAPPESLPLDFSTQAALLSAQQAFQQELVSPAKNSDIYNLLDPDPISSSQNTTPPPSGPIPTFSPITPFRFVNAEPQQSVKATAAPPLSTQELCNAASPFAFSTVKKQKPRKRVSIGISALLNPNHEPASTPSGVKYEPTSLPGFTPANNRKTSPRWTPINSQHASPRWTPINTKREGDGETTIADPTGIFDVNEVDTCTPAGTPAAPPSRRRPVRKQSSPLASRAVTPAPASQPTPLSLTSATVSQLIPSVLTPAMRSQAPPSTALPTVHHLSQSQPQQSQQSQAPKFTPSPVRYQKYRMSRRNTSPSASLSTSGTRPGHSAMLPDAQQIFGALLGDDEDVNVDEVVEAADSFLSTWDWHKEFGGVGA